ncbi:MAG: phospholipid carrier-dependent glycosyltransferase [Acidobacteria bacterium]|nr:phospholipid carrier-dependent glycosyltransferase [Acidobacteriota bacterium]
MSSPAFISRRGHLVLLTLIVVLGAVLRFTALGQGIPFAIGVDEPEIVERAVRMMKTGDFHPHFFDYPGLYIYIQLLTACVRFVAGGIAGLWANLDSTTPADFYLWGRAVTAAFGTLTIVLVYQGAKRISPLAGLISAAIFAVQSMHVRESHFVLTDVPTTFFIVLTWVLALRAHDHHTVRAFFWAGVTAGLAAATKYNGGVAILLPLLVLLIGTGGWPWKLRAIAAVTGGAASGFLAGAPYTVLALPEFLNAFAYLSHMYAIGPPPPEPGWVIYLKHLRLNFSTPGLLLAAGGLGLGLRRLWHQPRNIATLCWVTTALFALLYFWIIAGQRLIYGRYLLPVLPFLSVLAGSAVAAVLEAVHARLARPMAAGILGTVLVVTVCWLPTVNAVSSLIDARKVGTAEQTYRWMIEHLPAGAKIGIETRGILFDTREHRAENLARLVHEDFHFYQSEGFQYLVASSQAFWTALYANPPEPGAASRYNDLFRRLEHLTTFMPDQAHPGAEWRIYRVPTP